MRYVDPNCPKARDESADFQLQTRLVRIVSLIKVGLSVVLGGGGGRGGTGEHGNKNYGMRNGSLPMNSWSDGVDGL